MQQYTMKVTVSDSSMIYFGKKKVKKPHPNLSCHCVCTDFSNVPSHNTKVKSIEEKEEPKVHGSLWLDHNKNAKPKDGEHNYKVANDTSSVT